MTQFSFGTDPEFMLSKNGKIYSAIGIVKGTKDRRKKINKHEFYYDNVLAETAVAPGFNKEETIENIKDCLRTYAELVAPYKLECRASHEFPADQLKHRDSFKIGCDPESCAYSGEQVEPDEELFHKTNLRSAGGHIHLGYELLKNHPVLENYALTTSIFLLDLFLGIPSIFLDRDPTTKKRKALYGQAGRWRFPKYGIEYRSVGNFWLSNPKLTELIYDICDFTLEFITDDRWRGLWEVNVERLNDRNAWAQMDFHPSKCFNCIGYDVQDLRKAIDTMDVGLGDKFMEGVIKQQMPTKLFNRIAQLSVAKQSDFYKEWGLK